MRQTDKLNITFWRFLYSYLKKQPKVELLKKAEEDLAEFMDIATLSKKCSELDKLKALLLSPPERAIFDNLPVSVLALSSENKGKKEKLVLNHYRLDKSIKGDIEKLNEAYALLKISENKSELQTKLLGLYESQYLEDYYYGEHQGYIQNIIQNVCAHEESSPQ